MAKRKLHAFTLNPKSGKSGDPRVARPSPPSYFVWANDTLRLTKSTATWITKSPAATPRCQSRLPRNSDETYTEARPPMDSKRAESQGLAALSLAPIACIHCDWNYLHLRARCLLGKRLPAEILHGAQFPWNHFYWAPVSEGIPLSWRIGMSNVVRAFSDPGKRPRPRATTNFSPVDWTHYAARAFGQPARKQFRSPRRSKYIYGRRLISLFRLLPKAMGRAISGSLQISQNRG